MIPMSCCANSSRAVSEPGTSQRSIAAATPAAGAPMTMHWASKSAARRSSSAAGRPARSSSGSGCPYGPFANSSACRAQLSTRRPYSPPSNAAARLCVSRANEGSTHAAVTGTRPRIPRLHAKRMAAKLGRVELSPTMMPPLEPSVETLLIPPNRVLAGASIRGASPAIPHRT